MGAAPAAVGLVAVAADAGVAAPAAVRVPQTEQNFAAAVSWVPHSEQKHVTGAAVAPGAGDVDFVGCGGDLAAATGIVLELAATAPGLRAG